MKIEAAELRLISLPLKFRFETSFGVQTQRHIIVLTLYGEGLEGYAETVMEFTPTTGRRPSRGPGRFWRSF